MLTYKDLREQLSPITYAVREVEISDRGLEKKLRAFEKFCEKKESECGEPIYQILFSTLLPHDEKTEEMLSSEVLPEVDSSFNKLAARYYALKKE